MARLKWMISVIYIVMYGFFTLRLLLTPDETNASRFMAAWSVLPVGAWLVLFNWQIDWTWRDRIRLASTVLILIFTADLAWLQPLAGLPQTCS